MQFTELNLLPELLKAIDEKGYSSPSPIQQQAIPAVLAGRDLMAAAQTGTGKTAGFTLPLLQLLAQGQLQGRKVQSNHVRALILTPTRELAAQVAESVTTYGKHLPLRSTVVFGGVKINPQMMAMRRGVDVLIATPGRLLDLYQQNAVKFGQLEVLVLDEADRMLDMGFIHDIKKILALLPKKRQNLLFSATFSEEIRTLARGLVANPLEVSVAPANTTAERVEQLIYPVDKNRKAALVTKLINDNNWQQVLIFTKTKHMANKLSLHLDTAGIKAAPIHGNKSQNARTKALADFKAGTIRALVATDIAARGLDIDQLPQVVNFELPNVAEDYVHRIGRTGRAGAAGHAISLVCADEGKELAGIERLIKQQLPRQVMPGFEPVHPLGESKLNSKPYKPKKPKAPRSGHRDGQRAPSNKPATKPARS
ncbi:DEAD/DEAH box helicase [Rheinheimera fenheensis]|uniref:DEAD/DEAH box helicase n=1 Tax=Rheinheimera fenheensis TaxID=3152295 RepID=UPI0032608A2A